MYKITKCYKHSHESFYFTVFDPDNKKVFGSYYLEECLTYLDELNVNYYEVVD